MPLSFKNPSNPSQVYGPSSVPREVTYGTNFSNYEIGGFMQVYTLQDLIYTIPTGQTGLIEYTGNTIPIRFIKGENNTFNPDVLFLNSDNISSGRRKLGMLAYVQENQTTYQYVIDDYDTLWDQLLTLSGASAITQTDYTTTVNSLSQIGRDFISLWTGSTIEDVSGVTRANARWRKFPNIDVFVTGGTYNAGNSELIFTNNTGGTFSVTGLTSGFTVSVSANTGLGLEGNTLYTIYNTILDPNLEVPEDVGGVEAGTTVSQLSGLTLVQLFDELLFPTLNPTYTIPTIGISGVANTIVEVGSTLNLNISANSTKNDAGIFTQLRLLRNGSSIFTDTTLTTSSASNIAAQFGFQDPNNPNSGFTISPTPYSESYTVPAPAGLNTSTATVYKSDGNYNVGLPKNDSKGSADTRTALVRSVNAPQAASNNFESTSYTYTGIYPYYWGTSVTPPTTSTIANEISGGTANKVLSSASGTITIDFGASSEYLWFAHFENYTTKTKWFVTELNQGVIGGGSNLFNTPQIISVDSFDGYWNTINYKIYIGNYQTSTFADPMQLRNS
jgi:hypothetical protein